MTSDGSTDKETQGPGMTGRTVARRGLIAGAATLAAGLIAKQSAQPVAAATTMLTDTYNQAANFTGIVSASGPAGFQGESKQALSAGLVGLNTVDQGIGTKGLVNNGIGVQGGVGALGTLVNVPFTLAVQGINYANGQGSTAVQGLIYGQADSTFGMEGRNDGVGSARIGVLGTIGNNEAGNNSTAVVGLNTSTGTTGSGVQGNTSASLGGGVVGSNNGAGVGVQGQSQTGHGLVGVTSTQDGNHAGLIGTVQVGANGVGLRGSVSVGARGLAGAFDGDVTISGALRVYGAPKSAAVQHPHDGTYRLLYCVESTESWFEDFGKAKLANGAVDVKLDPDFAAVVHTDDYHVFLTHYGEEGNGLSVAQMRPDGFTVKERNKGTGNHAFSYRVVAKRADIKGERLAKVPPPPVPPATIAHIPMPEIKRHPGAPPKKP